MHTAENMASDRAAHPPAPPVERPSVTSIETLEQHLAILRDRARDFARLPIAAKIGLLRDAQVGVRDVAADWVAAACRAKGISFESPISGEEWLTGPAFVVRAIRF